MKVGLTYDLRADYLALGYSEEETAELDRPDTIDAIEGALAALGHETDRIGHLRALVGRLAAGDRWDLVFNIAEGLHGYAREAQIPALLEGYGIPCTFSDALVLALTLHKGTTKHVLRSQGVPTPEFFELSDLAQVDEVRLPLPLFAKPIAEGTGMGVTPASVIRRREDLRPVCERLLAQFRQPVLIEEFMPGRELTVGIVGTGRAAEVVGTIEVVLLPAAEQDVYSYVNKERCEELVRYDLVRGSDDPLVRRAEANALRAWRVLGCRDAGRVDVRADAQGEPKVLELNPLSGLHPEHSDLPIICTKVGIPYLRLIERIVASAAERVRQG